MARFKITLALCLIAYSAMANSAGNDDLWEITSKTEMAGMPSIPAQTSKVCTPKGKATEKGVPHDDSCKVLDYKQSGNKTTYRMVCSGADALTGTGEIIVDGPNAYHGTTRMQGKIEGETMDMKSSFSSKRIDSCIAEDADKYKKMAADMNASACRKGFDSLYWQNYIGSEAAEACKPFKNEFCSRVSKIGEELRTPTGYTKYGDRDWKGSLNACGQPSDSIAKAVCGRAVGDFNWDFVGKNCPAETETIVKEHCEGRDYTSIRTSQYAGLCGQYASKSSSGAASKSDGIVDTISKQTGATTESAGQALDMGKKALKGLFNF